MRRSWLQILFAALFFALVCGGAWAQSSSEPAKPNEPASAAASPQSGAAGEAKPEGEHGAKSDAKEEDEHAEFKESASVKWLAKVTGMSPGAAYWVSTILNFAIVAGLLGWFLRPVLAGFFRERTAGIQKGLEEARRASEEASRRLAEIEARLAKLDAETAEMRAAADHEAGKEEEAGRRAAEEAKAKIVQGAEQEIAAAARLARSELKSYAAELAVTLAEKKIEVSAATDRGLVREFTEQLGKDK